MWRLGVPTVLMVAFALIGLTTEPWRADEVPRPGRTGALTMPFGSRTPGLPGPVRVTRPVEADPAWPAAGDGLATLEADDRSVPEFRLPEELAPVGPDVVAAMPPEEPDVPLAPGLAHTHLDDGAHDDALLAEGALAAQEEDDFQGPEPSAVFWFGPQGLEWVRTSEGAPR